MTQSRNDQKNTDMEKLQKELDSGIFRKLYLLYGEERYLVLQYRDRIIHRAVSPEDTMNLNIHKGASPDVSEILDECLSVPFFAERRAVVLQDTGFFAPGSSQASPQSRRASGGRKKKVTKESPQDMLIRLFEELPDSTVLVFAESAVDRRGRLFKAAAKTGMAVNFEHPDEDALRSWILSRFQKRGIRITRDALEMLLERSGPDMTWVSADTDKLAACAGDGGTLTVREVGGLVRERLETRIFDLIDAAGHRNRREVIRKYDELIRMQEEPGRILYLLGRQFNLLYQIKVLSGKGAGAPEMMRTLDLKYSFQLRKLGDQARAFRTEQLRSAVEDCVRMEEKFKSGKIDAGMAVELLLVKYSR